MTVEVGDEVRVGRSSTVAKVIALGVEKDSAGKDYTVAVLSGARDRVSREETSRLTVVKKAGAK